MTTNPTPTKSEPFQLSPQKYYELGMWWLSEAARKGKRSTAMVRVGAVLVARPERGFPSEHMVLARAHNGKKPAGLQAIEDAIAKGRNLEGATLYLSHVDARPHDLHTNVVNSAFIDNKLAAIVVPTEDELGFRVYEPADKKEEPHDPTL